jgi:hypothetical protein
MAYNQNMKAKKITGMIVVAIVILVIGVAVGYFWGQNNKNQAVTQAKTTATQAALKQVSANTNANAALLQALTPAKTTTSTTCNADELSLSSSVSDGAAGTITYAIVLTNTGKRTCTLAGFPGVSLVNDNGNQIGSPAERASNYTEKTLTVAPGQKVKALASVADEGNFPAGKCQDGATKLRVYPPNDTGYLSVATDIKAWCPGFEISPVLAD